MNQEQGEPDDLARGVEATLFAAEEPMTAEAISAHLGGADVRGALQALKAHYADRGIRLVEHGRRWQFQTAPDLAHLLRREKEQLRRLSRAATEVLAIVAYHEPVSRAEIEAIRGVQTSSGTLDVLMEAGWIRMRGRRRTPGRPVTYGTTEGFLDHFGLETLGDLPGLEELKGAGLLSSRLPASFQLPLPHDGDLTEDEDPLDPDDMGDSEPQHDEETERED